MLLRATHAKLMAAIASDPVGVELLKSRATALEGRGRPPLPDVMEMQHFLCEVLCCWRSSEYVKCRDPVKRRGAWADARSGFGMLSFGYHSGFRSCVPSSP